MLTADGEVVLERKYFWSKACGGVCPADQLSGVARASVSPGACEVCCLLGIGQDFAQAAEDLKRVGGLTASKERLRGIVEGSAKAARSARDGGKLAPSWTAPQAKLDDGRSRVYAGSINYESPLTIKVTGVGEDTMIAGISRLLDLSKLRAKPSSA